MCALAFAKSSERSHLHKCACPGGGIKNGELLQRAETEFDLFITSDQNIRYQQNLAGRSIAILELSTNDIDRIKGSAALIQATIGRIQPNEFKRLDIL